MADARFAGRVVYITGAASGVGRATATLFAGEGARVFGVDVNEAGVRETIATIRAEGGTAEAGTCDVASYDSVRDSVAAAIQSFGALHVLINAAGVGGSVRLEDLTEAEWQRVIGINLTGAFNTMHNAVPHLLQQTGANIVNVASIAGMRGQAYGAHYSASKAGLINLTRSIAVEFATRGLRANCVCPGGVKTPLIQHFIPRPDFEPQLVAYISPPSPHQLAEASDVAGLIAFLASEAAAMINGAAMVADFGTLA